MEEKMSKIPDKIGKISIVPLKESKYLKPYRAEFDMNGMPRYWDFLQIHDSVSVLIYNRTRHVLVLVRQFRPAMYLGQLKSIEEGSVINPKKMDLRTGYSLELCAGIVDKNTSIEEIAREEVLEECGYDIPVGILRKIFSFRNVGITGQQNTVFYAEVTDDQKVSTGGGIKEEGESIEVVEVTVDEIRSYAASVDLLSPPSFMAAIQWFLCNVNYDSEFNFDYVN